MAATVHSLATARLRVLRLCLACRGPSSAGAVCVDCLRWHELIGRAIARAGKRKGRRRGGR